tara:strand:- start:1035 stop:1931 length:897 start_codon:yes stop_codon:yes gene_type:complete
MGGEKGHNDVYCMATNSNVWKLANPSRKTCNFSECVQILAVVAPSIFGFGDMHRASDDSFDSECIPALCLSPEASPERTHNTGDKDLCMSYIEHGYACNWVIEESGRGSCYSSPCDTDLGARCSETFFGPGKCSDRERGGDINKEETSDGGEDESADIDEKLCNIKLCLGPGSSPSEWWNTNDKLLCEEYGGGCHWVENADGSGSCYNSVCFDEETALCASEYMDVDCGEGMPPDCAMSCIETIPFNEANDYDSESGAHSCTFIDAIDSCFSADCADAEEEEFLMDWKDNLSSSPPCF